MLQQTAPTATPISVELSVEVSSPSSLAPDLASIAASDGLMMVTLGTIISTLPRELLIVVVTVTVDTVDDVDTVVLLVVSVVRVVVEIEVAVVLVVARQIRSVVLVGGCTSYSVAVSHVVSSTHTRSVVFVGAAAS